MASSKTRSTGMWFLVIGIGGCVLSLPQILSPTGTAIDPTGSKAASCMSISGILAVVGITILFAAYLSARNAQLPVARAKLLPFAGSGLIVVGVAWLGVSNFGLSDRLSTNDPGFDVTVTPTEWTRIDIPRGKNISFEVEAGHDLDLSTCGKQSFILAGMTVHKINPDGTKGEPGRFNTSCIFLRARGSDSVGLSYTVTPAGR